MPILLPFDAMFVAEAKRMLFGKSISSDAAPYTGGLSVAKFIKVMTYQRMEKSAVEDVATCCARISRLEGMEAHARTADARLRKYFPEREFKLAHQ